MREVAIVAVARTALGKAGRGSLKDVRPDTLAAHVIKTAIERAKISPADVEDIVLGCAMPEAEQGMNVARIAGMAAGLPATVPAMTINRFCSSGLQSLAQAAASITAGHYDVAIAGGVESMTQIPMGGDRPSPNPAIMADNPGLYTPMGITSENVAKRFGVSRAEQDAFAASSHAKAAAAIAAGRFADEIVPVSTRVYDNGAWKDVTISIDDGVRADTTVEGLAALKPAFAKDGTTTAGNSSQMSDGAAAVLVMAREVAQAHGLPILGVLRSYAVVGVDPDIMGVGPAHAIPKAVQKAGIAVGDVGVFEINEAFASQAVYCVRELGIDTAKVNRNGGAIALGHPLGCTGAKLTASLLHEMQRTGARYGVVSMCIGGGMGAAAVFEREG